MTGSQRRQWSAVADDGEHLQQPQERDQLPPNVFIACRECVVDDRLELIPAAIVERRRLGDDGRRDGA